MWPCLTLLAVLLVATPPAPARPAAEELARALQRRYDRVGDFAADFLHTYEGGVLQKRTSERGHVLIKKPGRMRWTYLAPERKLFVSDGKTLYSYLPHDKQVIVSTIPPDDQATLPALFLAGKGDLSSDFRASYDETPSAASSRYVLKLVPLQAQRDYDWLMLLVDRDSLQIRGLVSLDAQGGRSTLEFNNLKENVGVSDKEFVFKIPRGVDVITDAPRP